MININKLMMVPKAARELANDCQNIGASKTQYITTEVNTILHLNMVPFFKYIVRFRSKIWETA